MFNAAEIANDVCIDKNACEPMKTVLLVDDEITLEFLPLFLKHDFTVLTAKNYTEAIAILNSKQGIDAVITDYILDDSEQNGLDILAFCKSKLENIRRIMMTGYVDEQMISAQSENVIEELLSKPLDYDALVPFLKAVIK